MKPTGQRLRCLARVVAALGPCLSVSDQTELQLALLFAERLAPPECRAALWAGLFAPRGRQPAENGAKTNADGKRQTEQGRVEKSDACGIIAAGSPAEVVPCKPRKWKRRARSPSP